jgi:hypothetical protein
LCGTKERCGVNENDMMTIQIQIQIQLQLQVAGRNTMLDDLPFPVICLILERIDDLTPERLVHLSLCFANRK